MNKGLIGREQLRQGVVSAPLLALCYESSGNVEEDFSVIFRVYMQQVIKAKQELSFSGSERGLALGRRLTSAVPLTGCAKTGFLPAGAVYAVHNFLWKPHKNVL